MRVPFKDETSGLLLQHIQDIDGKFPALYQHHDHQAGDTMMKRLFSFGIFYFALYSQLAAADVADNDCLVVLRSAELTSCVVNNCVLVVSVDVRDDLNTRPRILFRSSGQDYFNTSGELSELPSGIAGYRRFSSFTHLLPGILVEAKHTELIPLIEVGEKTYFDHNVIAEPFGNYILSEHNEYVVRTGAGICQN